jgi:hypothetical protein
VSAEAEPQKQIQCEIVALCGYGAELNRAIDRTDSRQIHHSYCTGDPSTPTTLGAAQQLAPVTLDVATRDVGACSVGSVVKDVLAIAMATQPGRTL